MAHTGVCCASLEEPKALMKMGLGMLVIGHVNFLLGAIVHGAVLRHINLHKQARAMEYAISNVVALVCGMLGVVVGILAIVLSKNKRNRALTWSFFLVSLVSGLMATASAVGLMVAVVRAMVHGGRSLLTHCRFPDAIGYSSITNECPFDPTRIYSTTLILWVPLIVTSIVQLVFSTRCFVVCLTFLGLPCCKRPRGRRPVVNGAVAQPMETTAVPRYAPPPTRQHQERGFPGHPPSERQPLNQPPRGSNTLPLPTITEQHQLLERGTMERSSFWV